MTLRCAMPPPRCACCSECVGAQAGSAACAATLVALSAAQCWPKAELCKLDSRLASWADGDAPLVACRTAHDDLRLSYTIHGEPC